MNQQPKTLPFKSQSYLSHVRSMQCIVCGSNDTVAHHVKTRGSGGGDTFAVPLCAEHHNEIHTIGIDTFQERYGINLWQELFFVTKSWIEIAEITGKKNDD